VRRCAPPRCPDAVGAFPSKPLPTHCLPQAELHSLALADSILASRELPPLDVPHRPATPALSPSPSPPAPHGNEPLGFDAAAAATVSVADAPETPAAHARAPSAVAPALAATRRAEAAAPEAEGAAAVRALAPVSPAATSVEGVVAALAAGSSAAAGTLRGAGAALESGLVVLGHWLFESVTILAQVGRRQSTGIVAGRGGAGLGCAGLQRAARVHTLRVAALPA
jgi:hypothetical protein